jgi:Zn-dependent protease with chaperone function
MSRKGETIEAPLRMQELAGRMGKSLKQIRIIFLQINNAFASSKGITFTKKLFDEFNENEVLAIAAHEIEHQRGHHALYKTIAVMVCMILPVLSWSAFKVPILLNETFTQTLFQIMMNISLLAFMMVIMIPANWYLEIKADAAAARFVGKEHIRSALLKLTTKETMKQNSETHPSVYERIKYLDNLKL